MSALQFVKEYVKQPRTVGAVLPSSKVLARQMVESIDFDEVRSIAEFGPGTGVFTEEILRRKKDGTVLMLIEENREFCDLLHDRYGERDDVVVIHGSAEDVRVHMKTCGIRQLDAVVSGLPFASLPNAVSHAILRVTNQVLAPGGVFVTFQYSMMKKALFERYFAGMEWQRVWWNVPPAYVLAARPMK
ncbi:SAM-dependent methyltransferase [Rossellomorea marisflavi]|uniref:SAM-dependent methyltransferase n=1 Tax=Rossellomorea marisflavi TaxID=189381 RepID=A0A0M0G4S1_9BACI|nr:rRNA adenine N-6-methyltransferase family protein [Rossellomorea marisflavi]KON84783.1 SAM-dependent methyltransferase [Rossellomorea marisflavi]